MSHTPLVQGRRDSHIPWEMIRADFCHGEFRDGRHVYPTMEELAAKHGLSGWQIQRKSRTDKHKGLGSWLEQRYQAEALARARTDSIQADRIAESRATFDNHTLLTAHAGLQKLWSAIAGWDGFEFVRTKDDGSPQRKLRRGAANEIASLASALTSFQRVGRLALGYATDNVAWKGETRIELGEAAQAVLAAIDPKELTFEQIETIQKVLTSVAGAPGLEQVRGREVH